MGSSSFSILNDTTEDYYVTHYNCQAALWGSVRAVLEIGTPILVPTALAGMY